MQHGYRSGALTSGGAQHLFLMHINSTARHRILLVFSGLYRP